MTTNTILTTASERNTDNFVRIPVWGEDKHFEVIVPSFRKAGKIAKYIDDHIIAHYRKDSEWNGWGYTQHDNYYLLSEKDAATVKAMIAAKNAKKASISYEEKKDKQMLAWARRLSRLTGIAVETALDIAEKKLAYKKSRIEEMWYRQAEHYSVNREKLINRMYRESPLRRIEDKAHAMRILGASVRHSESNYEELLYEAKNDARWGEMTFEEAHQYARQNAQYRETVKSKYNIDIKDE